MELAALGASLGRSGVEPDKGRELLTKAAGEVFKLNELLTVAGYVKETGADRIIDIFADRTRADEAYRTLEQEAQGDHKTVVQGRRRQRTGAHA